MVTIRPGSVLKTGAISLLSNDARMVRLKFWKQPPSREQSKPMPFLYMDNQAKSNAKNKPSSDRHLQKIPLLIRLTKWGISPWVGQWYRTVPVRFRRWSYSPDSLLAKQFQYWHVSPASEAASHLKICAKPSWADRSQFITYLLTSSPWSEASLQGNGWPVFREGIHNLVVLVQAVSIAWWEQVVFQILLICVQIQPPCQL